MKIFKKINLNIVTIILAILVTFSASALIFKSFIDAGKQNENNNTEVEVSALSGGGTAANPYKINNASDFIAFQQDVSGGNSYEGKVVCLNSDINFSQFAHTEKEYSIKYDYKLGEDSLKNYKIAYRSILAQGPLFVKWEKQAKITLVLVLELLMTN